MQIFYAPDIIGNTYTLDEKESKHLIRVLRMKRGADVRLIDGKGNLYEGVIREADQNKCTLDIKESLEILKKELQAAHCYFAFKESRTV